MRQEKSRQMAALALAMAVGAMLTSCCIYSSILLGCMAIILAMLSRGSEPLQPPARTALFLAVAAIVATITCTISMFVSVISEYGSLEKYMEVYMNTVETMMPGLLESMPQ